MNALVPDIGHAHVAAFNAIPDTIWTRDENGNRLWGRPNYDKPGMGARIQREAFEAEWDARPISNIGSLVYCAEVERLEQNIAADAAQRRTAP